MADRHAGRGPSGLRRGLRGELGASFLSDPRLHQGGAGDDGCGLLLHGECRRAAAGTVLSGLTYQTGGSAADAGNGGVDGCAFGTGGRPAAPGTMEAETHECLRTLSHRLDRAGHGGGYCYWSCRTWLGRCDRCGGGGQRESRCRRTHLGDGLSDDGRASIRSSSTGRRQTAEGPCNHAGRQLADQTLHHGRLGVLSSSRSSLRT